MDEYLPLNNHEKARRDLWNAVYVAEFKIDKAEALREADMALKFFDMRFAHPEKKRKPKSSYY